MGKFLKVAFLGIGRNGKTIPAGYLPTFIRFHLELPYYYAAHSRCDVDVLIEDTDESYEMDFSFMGGGHLRVVSDPQAFKDAKFDVVVHWRKWNHAWFHPEALNVILSQDHSYGIEWMTMAGQAHHRKEVDGILVFPTWHHRQVESELSAHGLGSIRLIPGLTLGVDVDTYRPAPNKDPYHLLWASDPGRGLSELIPLFLRLVARDRRYHLTVTYPDYVKPESLAPYAQFFAHPSVKHLPGLRNGPQLWSLFNHSGILPYTSTFMEPSSRCHRQAMAAGSLVLYPPSKGTPSEILENGLNAVIEPTLNWSSTIVDMISSGRWKEIGENARILAVSESWQVQAKRFHKYFADKVG